MKIYHFFLGAAYAAYANTASAFTCFNLDQQVEIQAGQRTRVDLYIYRPQIQTNDVLLLNLGIGIHCRNDRPTFREDYVSIMDGSQYGGALSNFTGSLEYEGRQYPFPLKSETHSVQYLWKDYRPLPIVLKLTPKPNASGILISQGEKFATLILRQKNNTGDDNRFYWDLYASNNVVVPVGGCDSNTNFINVDMGNFSYDPTDRDINFSLKCIFPRNVTMSLSGNVDAPTIFKNTSNRKPISSGLGVQIIYNGSPVTVNTPINIGLVNSNPKDINFKSRYILNGNPVVTGYFKTEIGINFTYN